jgi:hypothetical protein
MSESRVQMRCGALYPSVTIDTHEVSTLSSHLSSLTGLEAYDGLFARWELRLRVFPKLWQVRKEVACTY